uniref:Uncharacterized protein n=1 Tax=Takifugu rubripes TaxID=31033 RepID=A0A674MTW0_TAKRU
ILWSKQHESMDPSCLPSMVLAPAGSGMVWGIFSWHTLGPLLPNERRLNAKAYLSIFAEHRALSHEMTANGSNWVEG